MRKRGRPRLIPEDELQEAVDTAQFGIELHSMFHYGLVQWEDGEAKSGIDVDRCLKILRYGRRYKVRPQETTNETS